MDPAPDRPDIEREYEDRLGARRRRLARHDRAHARFAYIRLAIAAVAIVVLVRWGLAAAPWLGGLVALFFAVAFAHARQLDARARTQSAVGFYERGLARIRHAWIGHGRTGEAFRQPDHIYADDLDIFGRGSLFELLATTRTHAGEETLAAWLLAPAPADVARTRQAAVGELAARLDLREEVAVLGDHVRVAVDAPLLRAWAVSPRRLPGGGPRLLAAAMAAATFVLLVWWARTGAPGNGLLAALLAEGLLAWIFKARVQTVLAAVDEPAHDLDVLAGLLRILERERFDSPHLARLQQAVAGQRTASAEIGRLSQQVAMLASRRNILFALPAALLLWATQWTFAIEAWRARAGRHIPRWLDTVGEFEALVALGGFAAEHPAFVFPDIVDGAAVLAGTGVAHPALPPAAVANDIRLGDRTIRLLVVSGSNMSGKSTWLRAVGTNVVLASMGAPVRAEHFRLSPLAVGAAMRVQDSLTDGRSRFFAEITRLKQVVDLARQRNGAVLFLLDEILGGTNSHDRRIGAEALLTGLVRAGAIGLVTTHDLALGQIVDRLPGEAANAHFEDRFEDGQLVFDYQLRAGLVRTSNALALMRSVGLDV